MGLFNRAGTVKLKERVLKRCFIFLMRSRLTGAARLRARMIFVRESFGNVANQHLLKDIWWGPRFSMIRKRLRHGHFDLQVCRECSGREPAKYLASQGALRKKIA